MTHLSESRIELPITKESSVVLLSVRKCDSALSDIISYLFCIVQCNSFVLSS